MQLFLFIWAFAICLTLYVINRINWATSSIGRIVEIITYYRRMLVDEAIYELENEGAREVATTTLAFLQTTTDVDMFIELMPKSKIIKKQDYLYVVKSVFSPWITSSKRMVRNKELWKSINDKIYGEGKWS